MLNCSLQPPSENFIKSNLFLTVINFIFNMKKLFAQNKQTNKQTKKTSLFKVAFLNHRTPKVCLCHADIFFSLQPKMVNKLELGFMEEPAIIQANASMPYFNSPCPQACVKVCSLFLAVKVEPTFSRIICFL